MQTPQIVMIPTNSLIPYANNPRHNEAAVNAVAASIKEFGFKVPIIITSEKVIVAGHTRYKAAQKLELVEVPCIIADDLSEGQIKAFRLADNKVAEIATWDMDALQAELQQLMEMEFDMSGFGFDTAVLLAESEALPVIKEDDYDYTQQPPPRAKPGEVWGLSPHRLMCGDSTLMEDMAKLMDGRSAKLIFTDPPWNVSYGETNHPTWKRRKILNDSMEESDFAAFLNAAFSRMKEAGEPGCMVYVVMGAKEWGKTMDILEALNFHWSSTIIWRKDEFVLSRKDYHTQYEPIWYGWNEGPRLCPLDDRTQSDVWDCPRPKVSEDHPTMKPIELVARAMFNSSRKGDIALDMFGGSGPTLLAAEQLGRICYIMEMEPAYCDLIIVRG